MPGSKNTKQRCELGVAILSLSNRDWLEKPPDPRRKVEFQSLLQSLPEAVFLFDLSARLVDLNLEAERLTGSTRESLLGAHARFLSRRVEPYDETRGHKRIVARALRGEQVRHERHIFRGSADSEPLEVLVSASPMNDHSGLVIGVLVVIQDVTELSALQREMASSERHFAVGQMTAGLAHDFNNVLSGISQAAAILAMQSNRSEYDLAMLDIIQSGVRRGAEIVANIREYLLGMREERARIDLGELLSEVLQLAQPMVQAHGNIQVVHRLEEGCHVYVHPPELRRVFTNLILNALDAMPQGGTLTVTCSRSLGRVVAAIQDTGTGIPLDRQKMVFSPYFSTKAGGTGLGLAGARRAVEGQGGHIRFESVPGAGTTFYVLLSLANGDQGRNDRTA
jgi:PAS domain S-box-containing protein